MAEEESSFRHSPDEDSFAIDLDNINADNPIRFSEYSRWTKVRKVSAMVKSWYNENVPPVDSSSMVDDSVSFNEVSASACSNNRGCANYSAGDFLSDKESSCNISSDDKSCDEDGCDDDGRSDSLPLWDVNWTCVECFEYGSSSEENDSDACCSNSDLSSKLVDWIKACKPTHTSVDYLLHALHDDHPKLPLTCKTLLQHSVHLQSNKFKIKKLTAGEYVHFGILNGLTLFHDKILQDKKPIIFYQINIDGLPLFKSSNTQLWPILGQINNIKKPFIIGCFCGSSKPQDVGSFLLSDFVREARELEQGFTLQGKQFVAKISCFLCDSPARAYIKQVKSHTGYNGCERCVQKGLYVSGRMTFPETHAKKRDDADFKMMRYEEHQLSTSPLVQLDVGLVSACVLDYMHLVCLGVTRRLLVYWTKGPLKVRMSASCVRIISDKLLSYASSMPSEFARKPRSLQEMDRWKATEFRNFLLYTGPVVLRSLIARERYENFMCFSVAMYLLLSPRFCSYYCDFAKDLLVHFVEKSAELYGPEFVVYNVHCLVHLCEDVRKYGNLDNVSCFPFENFLGKIKKSIRKPQAILQQIINRMNEGYFVPHAQETAITTAVREHSSGPVLASLINYKQYKELRSADFTIKISSGDNCICYGTDCVALVRNICSNGSNISLIIQRFRHIEPAFDKPLTSVDIGIYRLRKLHSRFEICDLSKVRMKYVTLLLDSGDGWIGIPLLHTMQH